MLESPPVNLPHRVILPLLTIGLFNLHTPSLSLLEDRSHAISDCSPSFLFEYAATTVGELSLISSFLS